MKTRIALLSGLLTLAAGVALATPTPTVPADQGTSLASLATALEQSPAPFAPAFPAVNSEIPLQLSQQAPWPCGDGPFGPLFAILGPGGGTTGPFDPTSCIPFPWPSPF